MCRCLQANNCALATAANVTFTHLSLHVCMQVFKTWREYFSFSYLNEAELELGKK
jgi:hypothetical protein